MTAEEFNNLSKEDFEKLIVKDILSDIKENCRKHSRTCTTKGSHEICKYYDKDYGCTLKGIPGVWFI